MHGSRSFASFALVAALTAPAAAAPASAIWNVDPVHSSAEFTVKHLVISNVKGVIPIKAATIVTSADSLVPMEISATLDVTALDTRDSDRDSDLRGSDWFDTASYPTLVFKSTKIDAGPDAQSFHATGDLTLHGTTKRIVLDGKILGRTVDGRGHQRVAYSAMTTIDRRDFGLNFLGKTPGGGLIAGTDVALDIEVEAIAKAVP
ncbi:MAG: YceI family protein [Candidatus Eremiobacteraeota bacterium]|nr:YceI family protein [Candidatus Eremiobacteraeota bacterium]